MAWLASDEALHVTGQVFRVIGSSIIHMVPWQPGARIKTEGRWDATQIGPELNTHVFRSHAAQRDFRIDVDE